MATQCRVAPSLGELEGHPNDVWGTEPYKSRKEPTVFFGLYDLRDYIALARHKGKAWILWAGGDLRNLTNGFMLNDGKLRQISKLAKKIPSKYPSTLLRGILSKADHYVENIYEAEILSDFGFESTVCPSFMGDIDNYRISYKQSYNKPKVYVSTGKGRQKEYGFDTVERVADMVPVEFHLYGDDWKTKHDNVIVHGRISKEEMNEQIKGMQCGLRINQWDGFSEILAKSVLWGQWPISRLEYPKIAQYHNDSHLIERLKSIRYEKKPNYKAKEFYCGIINKYPWKGDSYAH